MTSAGHAIARQSEAKFKKDFPIAFVVVAICTACAVFLRSRVAITNIAMIHLLGTTVVSVSCRRSVAILSALAGVASFYYFSVPPWNSFVLEDNSYFVILITTLTVSLVITTLTIKIRSQTARALEREERTRYLYQLIRSLSSETDVMGAARTAATTLGEIFEARVSIFLVDEQNSLADRVDTAEDANSPEIESEKAQAILDARERITDMLRNGQRIDLRFGIPLICAGSAVAILFLTPTDRERLNDPEQMHFLEALCDQIAAAIARVRHSAAVQEAESEIQAERTRNALLNAVSHDIKTPLASIYGAATTLLEEEARLNSESRHELVQSISDEAERLNKVVNNLLEMTTLDAGLQARKEWRPLEEIVGAALTRFEGPLQNRPVRTHIADDLPWICVDDVLLEQVFVNILENAMKYTPAGTGIEIDASRKGPNVIISIRDHGSGLLPGDESRVFEKFFRGKTEGARGVGLGLAICRAIVHGHGGTIAAENASGGGALFRMELPIGGVPPHVGLIPEATLT